jgi:outer membrane murein-binding lipoprotein Lpp
MGGTRKRTIALIAAASVAGIVMTGCSGSASDNTSSSAGSGLSAPMPAEKQANRDAAGSDAQAESNAQAPAAQAPPAEGKDSPAQAPDLSVDQRSIIYTGSITIRVEDVNIAAARATAIATGAGGFVGGDKRNTSDGSSDATMELRVPAEKFSSVVDQLARTLGKEEQRGISTEDVTEQTVDLDARITVQQARVDSGRQLLAKAKTLNELVMLEREVATRESDLASLQGKKRRLADLTALSTITVVLLDPKASVTPKDDDTPGFLGGLAGGWKALTKSLAVVLTVLGALLPWLLAVGLPLWAIWYAYRRYLRRRTRPVVPAFAGADVQAAPLPNRPEPARSAPPPPAVPKQQPEAKDPDDGPSKG